MTAHDWMRTVCTGSIRDVLQLYTPDAVLVPTYDDKVLQGHDELAGYFRVFMDKKGLCGRIDGAVAQPAGRTNVLSGLYTFRWQEKGRTKQVQARFTFVFVQTKIGWKILTQHSSEMPEPQGEQWSDQLKGGLADKRKPSDFNQSALRKGIQVEMEHTSNRQIATEIAMDHLEEHSNYYEVLPKAEREMTRLRRKKRRGR